MNTGSDILGDLDMAFVAETISRLERFRDMLKPFNLAEQFSGMEPLELIFK